MAGSAVIGALRVNLGIDTAAFFNGLKNANSNLNKFGATMKTGLIAASAAGVAAMAALAHGIKATIDTADQMTKAAQKFGVPVDELSRLKHAADLSGVSMDGLGTGLRKLAQNMQETANGANNIASQAFKALGIEVKNADGTLKASSAVMTEIAGKLSAMDNGAQKTAIAMAIFGRSGADLIPMLNAGSDGLASMMAEADALGITLDNNTGRAAEAFNDNLTRLGRTKDGLYLKLTAKLLPSLELLSEKFLDVANNGEAIEAMSSGLISAMQFMSNEVAQLAILANRLSVEFAGISEAFTRLKDGDFKGAWAAFQEGQKASGEMAASMKADIDSIFSGETVSQGYIQRRINDAFGNSGGESGESFVANFEAATKGARSRTKAALDPMVAEAKRIFEQTRTPLEAYQASIARLNDLLAAGAINQDTYNRAVFQAQDAFKDAEDAGKKTGDVLKDVGQSISSSFQSAFSGLIDGSKSVKDALKEVLASFAQLAAQSAFKSILGGMGGGGGFLGSLFGGLFGFANGGSFQVGGSGGVDSQLVAFKASPNERVTVTKPGQSMGMSGGGYAPVYNIDARGADAAAVARIEQGLKQRDRDFPKNVAGANRSQNLGRGRP